MPDETPDTPEHHDMLRMGAMYANAILTLATVRSAAEDVIGAVIPHPKFQDNTRLVWAREIEGLGRVLANTKLPTMSQDILDLLRKNQLPTYEQALQISKWLRGMMRLSEPEQHEIRAKLEALGSTTAPV